MNSHGNTHALVHRLRSLPAEQPWCEFKVNGATQGTEIAKYISALGNSARLHDESTGYLLWGVEDATHDIVDTDFKPETTKGKGNEDLIPWLKRKIQPAADFTFETITIEGKNVVVLRIPAPTTAPYSFEGKRWFRQGSYTKDLLDHPNDERLLWQKINQFEVESSPAATNLNEADVTELLDVDKLFADRPELARTKGSALTETLRNAELINYSYENGLSVPVWAALMFGRRITNFENLHSYVPRLLLFNDQSRLNLQREWEFDRGYALSFTEINKIFQTIRPGGERIEPSGKRVNLPELPDIAFREVYANALMHQDLDKRGNRITIEVFPNRTEITNPGKPLVDPKRFIDTSSITRNSKLGEALRLSHFVEQRGSGWDKIVSSLEQQHFPPATIKVNGSTTVTLHAYRPYNQMTTEERLIAVYQHTALSYTEDRPVTNASCRTRFGLTDKQTAQMSRLLQDAVDHNLIKLHDAHVGPRARRYIPFWAE